MVERSVPLAHLLKPVLDDLRVSSRSGVEVPTGFRDLDRLTGGLPTGRTWVVVGASGAGKSVLALDLARAAAVHSRLTTLFVTTAEAPGAIVRRLLAAEARVPLHHLEHGPVDDTGWARLDACVAGLADVPLHFVEMPALADRVVDDVLRAGGGQGRPQVLVIDHVAAGVGQVAHLRRLRDLARGSGVAVVAVAEQDVDHPSRQLRRLEACTDLLVEIVRPDQHAPSTDRAGEADLVVRRHRHGPVGTVTVAFQGHHGRFVDIA